MPRRTRPASRTSAAAASVALALGSMGMSVLATLTVLKDGGAGPGNAPGEIYVRCQASAYLW